MLGTRGEEGTLPGKGALSRVSQGEKELAKRQGLQVPPVQQAQPWAGGWEGALVAG